MTYVGVQSNVNYYNSLVALKKKELEQLEELLKKELEKLAQK